MTVLLRLPISSSFLITVVRSRGSRSLIMVVRFRSRYSWLSPTVTPAPTGPTRTPIVRHNRRCDSTNQSRSKKILLLSSPRFRLSSEMRGKPNLFRAMNMRSRSVGVASDQWCSSMIKMIRGIGIPRSQSRIGMVFLLQVLNDFIEPRRLWPMSFWSTSRRVVRHLRARREMRRMRR